MKKIIFTAAILATGTFALSSCSKDNSVKPASAKVYSNGQDPKNLGSGDAKVYSNGQDPKNLGSGDAKVLSNGQDPKNLGSGDSHGH